MSDIFTPPSLSSANASLNIAESLAKLLDPKERQKIADDIKSHHALNDTEAKKASDARALIKEHSDILQETRNAEARIAKERKELEQEKSDFITEAHAERAKISLSKSDAKDALEKAQTLHQQAIDIQNRANAKELDLSRSLAEHAAATKKLLEDRRVLEKDRKEIEEFKKQVLELDAQTKAKVDALKKYNF